MRMPEFTSEVKLNFWRVGATKPIASCEAAMRPVATGSPAAASSNTSCWTYTSKAG